MSQDVIRVKNMSLSYKIRSSFFKRHKYVVINNISFCIKQGEVLGILGRNGSGKSSLLRILSGIVDPTNGSIKRNNSMNTVLLSLGLGFRPDLTGRDNALLSLMLQGLTKDESIASLEEVNEFAELGEFYDQPIYTYSSGMRSRLGLATALKANVDILLIDEVLSVGDISFRNKAQDSIKKLIYSEKTVVFVSHNIQQIKNLCSRALWLENGNIKAIGDVNTVADEYEQFMKIYKSILVDSGRSRIK